MLPLWCLRSQEWTLYQRASTQVDCLVLSCLVLMVFDYTLHFQALPPSCLVWLVLFDLFFPVIITTVDAQGVNERIQPVM